MALSAFPDETKPPTPAQLRRVLGKAHPLWNSLIAHVGATHVPITEQWSFAGEKSGWSLRLRRDKRVILYLTPQSRSLTVGVVLGERAVRAAHEAKLPQAVLALIDAAPRYAEGRGIRTLVANRGELAAVKHLVALKGIK